MEVLLLLGAYRLYVDEMPDDSALSEAAEIGSEIAAEGSETGPILGDAYRGELDRGTTWRSRLDQTTAWG